MKLRDIPRVQHSRNATVARGTGFVFRSKTAFDPSFSFLSFFHGDFTRVLLHVWFVGFGIGGVANGHSDAHLIPPCLSVLDLPGDVEGEECVGGAFTKVSSAP